MKKVRITNFDLLTAKLLAVNDMTCVRLLKDGRILKTFSPLAMTLMSNNGINIERKILDARSIKGSPEIVIPSAAAYSALSRQFIGYTMDRVNGQSYTEYESGFTPERRCDLQAYTEEHSRIEAVLGRNPNIVFTDICTWDNIIIDEFGNFKLIDYDGLQVDPHKTICLSTNLGDPERLMELTASPKYFKDGRATKELDMLSSATFYFGTALGANLAKVNWRDPITGTLITLDDFFWSINLDDPDLCHKVWKLFQPGEKNEFLGDTTFHVAEKYDLVHCCRIGSNDFKQYVKK